MLHICDSSPAHLYGESSHSSPTNHVVSIAGARDRVIEQEMDVMDEISGYQVGTGSLSPGRVAASATQQAARHERALRACLAELGGVDEPTSDFADSTRRRAMRHAERAISLSRTAIRVNRDPLAETLFAALLERHERNALLVEHLTVTATSARLSAAV
jgi:hypothetical protein